MNLKLMMAAEKNLKKSKKIIFPEINFVVYKRKGKEDYHSIKYVSKKISVWSLWQALLL